MSTSIDKETKDETRIGEYAAKQPLSGVDLVTRMRFKGFSSSSFIREEAKKAS
ncbi:MAG: hypothetical protein WCD70_09090 [Alphaproteobacteria bacterium]